MPRSLLLVAALLLGGTAMAGLSLSFSGATWSDTSPTPVLVTAANDWTPPVVTASVPANTSGTVTVTATVTDRSDIASVSLEYAKVGSSTWTTLTIGCTPSSGASPLTYSCSWATTSVDDGDYRVRATAADAGGYTATSAPRTTTVSNAGNVALAPVPGVVSGNVPLSATYAGAVTPTTRLYVDYLSGSTWIQVPGCYGQGAATLSCTLDTTILPNGAVKLRARAESSGVVRTDERAGIVVDNDAPTVALTVPTGILSGAVTLTATAGDPTTSVTAVTFEYQRQGASSWTTCGTDSSAPYTCDLATGSLTDGTYLFRATATDAAGNRTTTATQSRTLANAPATVAVSSPTNGATVTGTVSVTATATSPRGVQSVTLQVRPNGGTFTNLCTATTAPYTCSWNTTTVNNGAYEVRAVLAEGTGGTVPSAAVPVTVQNAAGTVTVTAPTAGSTVQATVPVTATAASPRGVQSVTLQVRPNGGSFTNLCTATTAPYTCSWNTTTVNNGAYDVRAVLTEGTGATVTAAAVSVNVLNVTGSVAVTAPTAGSTLHGTVPVTATATSSIGVTSVRLETRLASGAFAPLCTANAAPYTCSWNTTAISYGSYEVRAVMTHANGSQLTSATVAVTVDNRQFNGGDIDANPATSGDGPSAGDQLVFTFSGLVNLSTIKPGFTGSSTPVSVTLTAGATGNADDVLTFPGSNLGSVNTGTKAIKSGIADFSGSTMTASQVTVNGVPVTRVVVTLGNATYEQTGSGSLTKGAALSWTPSSAVTNLAGVPCSTAVVIESTGNDLDF